jgi:hemerythrin-like domain-containing protein
MQARGPLMIEHRLIEQMLNAIQRPLEHAEKTRAIDSYFVDTAVDFIRVYADRTHHGKEEDIMFRDLRKKQLSNEDRLLMDELVEDHIFSRSTTKALVETNMRYREGNEAALDEVVAHTLKRSLSSTQNISRRKMTYSSRLPGLTSPI